MRGARIVLGMLSACLTACAGMPSEPTWSAWPGSGQSWAQFRADDAGCRAWAAVGGAAASRPLQDPVVGGAMTGAAVGAVVGAALGGSQGIAPGGVSGALIGAAATQSAGAQAAEQTQRRYDRLYGECMYRLGHRVPLQEGLVPWPAPTSGPATPLPPPGAPPPPPPSWR